MSSVWVRQSLLFGVLSLALYSTGVLAQETNNNPPQSSQPPADAVTTLPEMVVSEAPEPSYVVKHATTATKTDTPIMETPLSVQVVPQQVIQDQQAIRLQDLTKNVSGVQTNFGYGELYEAFALRGFETNNTLRNGQRVGGGIGRNSVETANLESIEVLKGPAAMMYGRLEPDVLINVVTKKPLDTPYYSLQQQFGSYQFYRTSVDATGPLTQDASLLYRLNYSYFDADQFIRHAPHGMSHFIAPSLTWRPTNKLEFNLDLEYRYAHPRIANGIPAVGNRPAQIPIDTYGGVGSSGRETIHDLRVALA